MLPEEDAEDKRRRHRTGQATLQGTGTGDWKMTKTKVYESVWDAIEPDPVEAENLKLRSSLMLALKRQIKNQGLTQAEAAKVLGVTQPRISNLLHGKIDLFGLDILVKMAAIAGLRVTMRIKKAA
jgi:predicted XRE-type DNA-binding protein